MALARDLQARALAAEDDALAARLATAFHAVSRSIRQTLALDGRLQRERKLALREEASEKARAVLQRVQRRRGEVRRALAPLIWTEAEGDEDEAEALFEALDAHLMDFGPQDEAFADQPLEACVEAIRKAFGLPAANSPDYEEPGEAAGRQSSA